MINRLILCADHLTISINFLRERQWRDCLRSSPLAGGRDDDPRGRGALEYSAPSGTPFLQQSAGRWSSSAGRIAPCPAAVVRLEDSSSRRHGPGRAATWRERTTPFHRQNQPGGPDPRPSASGSRCGDLSGRCELPSLTRVRGEGTLPEVAADLMAEDSPAHSHSTSVSQPPLPIHDPARPIVTIRTVRF